MQLIFHCNLIIVWLLLKKNQTGQIQILEKTVNISLQGNALEKDTYLSF